MVNVFARDRPALRGGELAQLTKLILDFLPRKRNPLEKTTIDTWRYALDKWIYPFFEGRRLADINNRAMKEIVEHTAPKLSARSVQVYKGVVKSVVASAIKDDGEELFPRKWNEEYIDAPVIDVQRQPTTTADSLTAID